MENFLKVTAKTMVIPESYGSFHIILSIFGISIAIVIGRKWGRKNIRESFVIEGIGFVLFFLELYKQFFYYYIVDGQSYRWWIFPFQLCSVPLYLSLVYPFIGKKLKQIILSFFKTYTLLGGIFAFADPSGFLTSYWALTLHGFVWHFLLIFLGIFSGFIQMKENKIEKKNNKKTMVLFLILIALAQLLNNYIKQYGEINLFYISFWYPMGQLVFKDIASYFGQKISVIIYILVIIIGAGIIGKIWAIIQTKEKIV